MKIALKTDLNAVLSQLIIILHFGKPHYHGHDPFKMFSNSMTCLSAVQQQQEQQINVLKKQNEELRCTDFYLSTKAFFSSSSSKKF